MEEKPKGRKWALGLAMTSACKGRTLAGLIECYGDRRKDHSELQIDSMTWWHYYNCE